MLVRVNGRLVHQCFLVVARPRSRVRLELLDGLRLRCRYGWQLGGEEGGIYAGESAMVIDDPVDFPDPAAIGMPTWIASGDLHLLEEEAGAGIQLPLDGAAA